MEEKITIIEGPPPTFETIDESWALGIVDSPLLSDVAVTHLRTFNGPALVERCHRAWRKQEAIHLEFRASDGLEQSAEIVAARHVDTDEGQMLILWVRLPKDDVELEFNFESSEVEDDFNEEDLEDDEFDEDEDDDEDDRQYPLGPNWSM